MKGIDTTSQHTSRTTRSNASIPPLLSNHTNITSHSPHRRREEASTSNGDEGPKLNVNSSNKNSSSNNNSNNTNSNNSNSNNNNPTLDPSVDSSVALGPSKP
jgi:hypothetical protein